jgi:hypothetical protein
MNTDLMVVPACRELGMRRSSFYYLVQNNPETITDIKAIIDRSNRN